MAYCILRSYKLKLDPFDIFSALKGESTPFFLDSSLRPAGVSGRYSFLGANPFEVVETKNQEPFSKLRQNLCQYKLKANPGFPFLGGAVGFLSYDLGFLLEKKLQKKTKDDLSIPDSFFAFYNSGVVIDHKKKILYIYSLGFPEKKGNLAEALCRDNFKKLCGLLENAGSRQGALHGKVVSTAHLLRSNFSRQGYLQAVKKAQQYIKAGDIYQVNLSQRFHARSGMEGWQVYQRLRELSPSSFGAYLDCGAFQILSSSPELFLKLDGDLVTTRPMKGTRPRGQNGLQDTALKKNLLMSEKDKAELMMIVDLERNDLGRVCDYRSIKVTQLRSLEEYALVYQTTATVQGRLHKHKDRIDLLRACFPGGSITGCPKIRSMEIIEELEPTRRNIYTGAMGYFSFSGGMDLNILIRTILKKGEDLYFGVGGGIVADSLPESEYEETLVKAQAMIRAMEISKIKDQR